MRFDIILRKYEKKIQMSLKSDKRTATEHEDGHTFVIIFSLIIFGLRNISDKSCIEIKTHILCPVTYSANLVV